MSSTTRHQTLKMKANKAAADTYWIAVALTELLAAFVSFQWQQVSFPPT